MHKAAYMAIIFTLGLWTGGIFAPNQTPAQDENIAITQPADAAAQKPTDSIRGRHQEPDARVQP